VTRNPFLPALEAACQKTRRDVNRNRQVTTLAEKNYVKDYMSVKVGEPGDWLDRSD
jgi:hypothetical protein